MTAKRTVNKTIEPTVAMRAPAPIQTIKHDTYKLSYGPLGIMGSMGYHSARVMRDVDGTTPTRASGARHEQTSRDRLVNQSREFARDNLLYGGIIGRCVDFAIGNGYELVTPNSEVSKRWSDWIATAEISGRYDGAKLPRAYMREYLETGEGIALKVKGGKVQLCESEQIQAHDGIQQGIGTDAYGRPTKFYMSAYVNGNLDVPKPVKAHNVLFMCERERPSSVRGVPPCQTAFPMLHRINDVLDSEALTWQLLSRLALKHSSGTGTPFGNTTTNNGGLTVLEMPYSIVFEGSDMEDLIPIDHNRPSKDFPASVTLFCRMLGIPFGMPLELVLMDFTKSNFSQMRGALVLAQKSFNHLVDNMVVDFYEPLYDWKIREWIAAGELEDTPDNRLHSWVLPQFPWINELEEANATEKKIGLGLMSYEEACKTRERKYEDVRAARKREIIEAIKIAQEIEVETGERVPWQPFAGLPIGQTEQAEIVKQGANTEEAGTDAQPE